MSRADVRASLGLDATGFVDVLQQAQNALEAQMLLGMPPEAAVPFYADESHWIARPDGLVVQTNIPIILPEHGYMRSAGMLLEPFKAETIELGSNLVHLNGLWQPPRPTGHFVPPAWLFQGAIQSVMPSFGPLTFRNGRKRKPRPPADYSRLEPFVGYKTLKIVVGADGNLHLEGAMEVAYGVDATAECGNHHDHMVPDWKCSCGFYALKDQPTWSEHGSFVAEVELFGTVIEAEHGWRASRQRVLSLKVFRACHVGSLDCNEPAAGFQIDQEGEVYPICARHAPLGFATLADLTAQLGTECGWVDAA